MTIPKSPNVVRGRIIEYVFVNGEYIPRVVMLPSDICGQDQEFPEARQVTYGNSGIGLGIPILSTAHTCCEAISSGRYCSGCWSGGIGNRMQAWTFNVDNCFSAQFQHTFLEIASGGGVCSWAGTIPLRGGDLQIVLSCQSGIADNAAEKFKLVVSGCGSGTYLAGYYCPDPLLINFGNILAPECCACSGTTSPGQLNIITEANCHPVVIARHIGYTPGGIPLVARDNYCYLSSGLGSGCATMTCGLTASITSLSGDCGCMAGTYALPYIGTMWESISGSTCLQSPDIQMRCIDFPSSGVVCLQMDIACGATNIGTDTVCITQDQLEDLDVTFHIPMTDPTIVSGCGTCLFQWVDMTVSWTQILDNCVAPCNCVVPTVSGTFDGQQMTTDCSGAATTPACCIGGISVRVLR